jgi:hypothetical protein
VVTGKVELEGLAVKSDLPYTFACLLYEPTPPTATAGRVAVALFTILVRARWNPRQMDRLSVPMKVRQRRLGHGDASITRRTLHAHCRRGFIGGGYAARTHHLGPIARDSGRKRIQIENGLASAIR